MRGTGIPSGDNVFPTHDGPALPHAPRLVLRFAAGLCVIAAVSLAGASGPGAMRVRAHGNPHDTPAPAPTSSPAAGPATDAPGTPAPVATATPAVTAPPATTTATATTAPHGNNRGDVWTDNVGSPAGPGHEQDPHLACADINIWASGLGTGSGTYTIDSWEPSGSGAGDQAYPGTRAAAGHASWSYDAARGGDQVVSVVHVAQLIRNAIADGSHPQAHQGFHFKLQFSNLPQKHKVFWINCPAPAATPTPAPTSGVQAVTTQPVSVVQSLGTPDTGTHLPLLPSGLLLALGAACLPASRRRTAGGPANEAAAATFLDTLSAVQTLRRFAAGR